MNLEKYRLLFVDEATDHLAEMSNALSVLEAGADAEASAEAIDTLFRMMHSIKGMAASLDYASISDLAHQLEDWLEPLRDQGDISSAARRVLFDSVRALKEMVAWVDQHAESPPPRDDLIGRVSDASVGSLPDRTGDATAPPLAPTTPPLPRSVRVRTSVVDKFLGGVGELVQRQARLEELHAESPYWEKQREFGDELDAMAHVVRGLRRRVLDLRTTPVRRVFDRLPGVAAELANELGKRVRVEFSGEDTEADRAVVDHLDAPLLHLIRNAVDHGLESPEARERAGKDPIGRIRLSARTEGGRLHVRFEEDGRGVDVEAVRRRAIDRGLLLEEMAEDLSPERVCELIFEPRISTRDEVTSVSGRGVGLDAVKRTIEGLGGTLSLDSRPGEGTCFEIDLPSMAALQRVLVVEIGGERVALSVAPVEAVLSIEEGRVERAGDEAFFVWKDEPLPLLDLAERLGLAAQPTTPEGHVLVSETRGFRLALRVDRVVTDIEVFVREVPPLLARIQPLGGLAILPDGVPVFLLEVSALVEDFL